MSHHIHHFRFYANIKNENIGLACQNSIRTKQDADGKKEGKHTKSHPYIFFTHQL